MATHDSLSKLSAEFLALLPAELRLYATGTSEPIFRIPAAAVEVGDLEVFDDDGELTAVVGRIWHAHFGSSRAREAITWIQDMLADKVRIRVEQKEGKFLMASSWQPDLMDGGDLCEGADAFQEYTWSGQKV